MRSSSEKIEKPAAIEKFLAKTSSNGNENPEALFRWGRGKKFADAFGGLGEFFGAGLALLELVEEVEREQESKENGGEDEGAGEGAEGLAEIGEGEVVPEDEQDGDSGERPGGKDVPEINLSRRGEASVKEIVERRKNEDEDKGKEPDVWSAEKGRHGVGSVDADRMRVNLSDGANVRENKQEGKGALEQVKGVPGIAGGLAETPL